MESLNICDFLTSTCKFNWLTSNLTNRESCTTTCVTVNFSKNNTCDIQLFIELLGNISSFLTNHAINNQEDFVWMGEILDITQLLHEGFVNLQTTRRINQDIVIFIGTRLFQTIFDNLNRWCLCSHIKNRNINLLAQGLQLVNGCWTIDIRRNHHWASFLFFNQLIS